MFEKKNLQNNLSHVVYSMMEFMEFTARILDYLKSKLEDYSDNFISALKFENQCQSLFKSYNQLLIDTTLQSIETLKYSCLSLLKANKVDEFLSYFNDLLYSVNQKYKAKRDEVHSKQLNDLSNLMLDFGEIIGLYRTSKRLETVEVKVQLKKGKSFYGQDEKFSMDVRNGREGSKNLSEGIGVHKQTSLITRKLNHSVVELESENALGDKLKLYEHDLKEKALIQPFGETKISEEFGKEASEEGMELLLEGRKEASGEGMELQLEGRKEALDPYPVMNFESNDKELAKEKAEKIRAEKAEAKRPGGDVMREIASFSEPFKLQRYPEKAVYPEDELEKRKELKTQREYIERERSVPTKVIKIKNYPHPDFYLKKAELKRFDHNRKCKKRTISDRFEPKEVQTT